MLTYARALEIASQDDRVDGWGPPLAPAEVDVVEAKLGWRLPASFRRFLCEIGCIDVGTQVIGVVDDGASLRLAEWPADEFVGLPDGVLPLRWDTDGDGEAWCLDLRVRDARDECRVVFWQNHFGSLSELSGEQGISFEHWLFEELVGGLRMEEGLLKDARSRTGRKADQVGGRVAAALGEACGRVWPGVGIGVEYDSGAQRLRMGRRLRVSNGDSGSNGGSVTLNVARDIEPNILPGEWLTVPFESLCYADSTGWRCGEEELARAFDLARASVEAMVGELRKQDDAVVAALDGFWRITNEEMTRPPIFRRGVHGLRIEENASRLVIPREGASVARFRMELSRDRRSLALKLPNFEHKANLERTGAGYRLEFDAGVVYLER